MTKFDLWLVFSGNPWEVDPDPLRCKFCGSTYRPEDGDEDLCRSCARAGVFLCEYCNEWKAADQRQFEDLCDDCVRRLPTVAPGCPRTAPGVGGVGVDPGNSTGAARAACGTMEVEVTPCP